MLTERQQEVYEFMQSYFIENHRIPTSIAIKKEFDFSSENGAHCHVKAICKKGFIEKVSIGNNKSSYKFTKFKALLEEK